jgi:type IV pilus assembly protein PilA
MIVIAIIGILAAVALPAYSDYTQRAKMSEVILAGSGCRTELTEYISINGGPSASAIAGFTCASASSTSKYVHKVEVASTTGIVTLTSQGINSGVAAAGATVTLTPTTGDGTGSVGANPTGIYSWTCVGSVPSIMPSSCKG